MKDKGSGDKAFRRLGKQHGFRRQMPWRVGFTLLVCGAWGANYYHIHSALQTQTLNFHSVSADAPSETGDFLSTNRFRLLDDQQRKERAKTTSHWCHSRDLLETGGNRATCLFRNLCVGPRRADETDPREVEFFYVTPPTVANGTLDLTNNNEASFTLGVGPHSGDKRVLFTPVAVTWEEMEELHPTRKYVSGTSALLYEYNAENFGHLITDFVMPIYVAYESFGLLDEDMKIYRYSIADAIGWSCDYQAKVRPWNANHCKRFYDMVPAMIKGHRPIEVLNGTDMEVTCFENVVVGMAMYSDDCIEGSHGRKQNLWSLCNVARQRQFWNYRNYVLQNVGVSLVPPIRHKITVTKRSDGRTLHNLDALISNLTGVYGSSVEIITVEWPELSFQEQLELISTTTVHLTPPGGVSFISLFLPKWATSVRLYPGDYKMEWHIFHYLGYMTVEHVDCPNGAIPITEAMQYVARGLQRFEDFCEQCRGA
ncbi:hypothetical protein ACHAWF_007569 [Thalassiosira exigua]